MALEDRKNWNEISRVKPGKISDAVNGAQRAGSYGEPYVQAVIGSKLHALADEGSYFLAANATPGTGIAGHAAPVLADLYTKSFVLMRNTAAASAGTRIYLDFIELQVTAAGAGATNASWAAELDTGATRLTSGGTAITAVNPNMQSNAATIAALNAGANVTAAATSAAREIGSGVLRTVVPVVGDRYVWTFGTCETPLAGMIVGGTAIANIAIPMPPVVLGPTDMFLLHLMGVSQSGAHSYEIRAGWWER
mgnify:CR=1 FL=1